jgi:sugar transferase (PEP-CTERM/EpsH1 system associated)
VLVRESSLRVLWVKSGGLLPLDTGGKIRSFQLARELARKHQVTLFTFYPEHPLDRHIELEQIFSRVVRIPMKLAKRASFIDCVNYGWNLFSARPHAMTKYCRAEIAKELREHLRRERYDVIICDFLLTAAVIPWDVGCPKIIFTHNVEAVIWRRHYEVSRNPVWKMISWREYRTMDNMERKYLRQADHILTVSEADKQTFSEFLDPSRITVIQTGVDTEYFHPSCEQEKPKAGEPSSMVFTGSMDWLPNEDGIFYFAEQILPLVRKELPDATLTVVGRSPSARLLALAEKNGGIKITGRVDDVRPYMNQGGIYIVPLRIGGGTRIKIFEAMAMGKAVVSTSIGAEGLPVTHDENIVLADRSEEFAGRVILLLRDAALRKRIGNAARALVEQNYSWSSVATQFSTVFESLSPAQASATEVVDDRLAAATSL